MPQPCVPVPGELTLPDADALADLALFSLAGASGDLPGFTIGEDSKPSLIDVQPGKVVASLGEREVGSISMPATRAFGTKT